MPEKNQDNSTEQEGTLAHFFSFNDLQRSQIWPDLASTPYNAPNLDIVRFEGRTGFTFSDEGHPEQQITILYKGRMRFRIGDEERELGPGDGVYIAPNVPHGGETIEDMEGFDIFFPKRSEAKYMQSKQTSG